MHFPSVIVDDMWVPTHFHGHEMERTPTLHAMFRNRMLATLSSVRGPGARRLYVKRAESRGERTVTNGEEVEGLLREFDFTVVSMEQFSTAQQMVLARDAEVMFGPHGAGMVHNLWMAPGSTVIELLPVTYQNHCMEVHARLLGHRYHGFVVENLSGKNNMCVDVAELRSLFKLIGL